MARRTLPPGPREFATTHWSLLVAAERVLTSAMVVLGAVALIQLLSLAFRTTAGQAIFRLAVVDAVVQPNRGLHDRLAGTWVVRR